MVFISINTVLLYLRYMCMLLKFEIKIHHYWINNQIFDEIAAKTFKDNEIT